MWETVFFFGQSFKVRKDNDFGTAALPNLPATTTTPSTPPLQQSSPLRPSPPSCSAELLLRAPFPFPFSVKVGVEEHQQSLGAFPAWCSHRAQRGAELPGTLLGLIVCFCSGISVEASG